MLLFPGTARSLTRNLAFFIAIVSLAALFLATVAGFPSLASAQVPEAGAPAAPVKQADAGAPAKPGDAGAPAKSAEAGAPDNAGTSPNDPDGGSPGPSSGTPGVQAAGPVINIPQSEAEKAEGQPISRIDISGNRRVAKDDIVSYLREKPGNGFKVDNLASDVRALWDSGFFDDVEVDMTREDRGVILRFLVRERPNIKSIEFEGNSEIENDKLQEAIELKANTILSVPAVRRSVQKIKDAYAEKGYFLADVESTVEPQRDNEVVIKFKITEHSPVTVRRISFVGNYSVPDDDLRAVMQTGQGSIFSFGSGGPYRQDVFERDVLLLNALYYDKGYMNVQVGTPRVMLTQQQQHHDGGADQVQGGVSHRSMAALGDSARHIDAQAHQRPPVDIREGLENLSRGVGLGNRVARPAGGTVRQHGETCLRLRADQFHLERRQQPAHEHHP